MTTLQRVDGSQRALRWMLAVLVLAVVLGGVWLGLRRGSAAGKEVVLFCAAGVRTPVQETIDQYEKETGVRVRVQFGGSDQLLSNLEVGGKADVYLAADESYLAKGRKKGLLAESIPVASQRPVIAVGKGNPKQVKGIEDLLRPEVRLALADPAQAAIGKVTKELLRGSGQDEAVLKRAVVFKPTVNDVANDVKIGSADAAFVWDATVREFGGMEAVRVPLFDKAASALSVAVCTSTAQPAAALHFARYLAAKDRGLAVFAKRGYEVAEGDVWEATPTIKLFSGAVNRPAVEETVRQFEQREGVHVERIYNGCGILVAQMKSGSHPDCYLACDVSFVPPVADLFLEPTEVSGTEIVIAVPKGNPAGIKTLADLGRQGLRIGVGNAKQSTLGELTRRILERENLLDKVMENVRSQTPTADTLVAQLTVGSLDAVVVYEVNLSQSHDKLDMIRLTVEGNKAVQPFSVGKNTNHRQLVGRLLDRLRSAESRKRYEKLGFEWRATQEQ